jgi:uncharacterized protein YbbC (DUF1343 family)
MVRAMKKKIHFIIKFFPIVCLLIFCTEYLFSSEKPKIYPGAYQTEEYLYLLQNKKTGVVANNGSLIGTASLIDTLLGRNIRIEKIFTPEHGFRSTAAAGEVVSNDLYGSQQIPVISLYGKTKKPAKKDVQDIDVMVFDLQDVGVRFYTYISTLQYVMEACAENGKQLIVLDRPNPNGFYIDGPVLEEKYKSFVGLDPVPVVYGMTIGEYALMINGENWLPGQLKCNLTIIKCKNYNHNSFYELPVAPSPNLRDMKAIYLYPSFAFFEGTVASEGRGTDYPFIVAGHPDYPDRSFSFVPKPMQGAGSNPKLNGRVCYGVNYRNINTDSLRLTGHIDLKILMDFYSKLNLADKFFTGYFDTLAGTDLLRKMIIEGKNEAEIRNSWKPGLENFKKIRAKYLLYPDF